MFFKVSSVPGEKLDREVCVNTLDSHARQSLCFYNAQILTYYYLAGKILTCFSPKQILKYTALCDMLRNTLNRSGLAFSKVCNHLKEMPQATRKGKKPL